MDEGFSPELATLIFDYLRPPDLKNLVTVVTRPVGDMPNQSQIFCLKTRRPKDLLA